MKTDQQLAAINAGNKKNKKEKPTVTIRYIFKLPACYHDVSPLKYRRGETSQTGILQYLPGSVETRIP